MTNEMAVANPFANAPITTRPSALTQATSHREVAEVQAALWVAARNPRDEVAAMDRILMACTRPSLAAAAVYTYARGGSNVSGPSIRLAEAIAQCWGNLNVGVRELSRSDGVSEMEAYAWDTQTNTRSSKVFHVAHTRDTREGRKPLRDERDIYELAANHAARRLRACILALVPGDVVEAAVKQCEATLTSNSAVTGENIKQMTEAFAKFNVTREQLEKRVQRRLDAITPALLVQLRKIYNSLAEGMSTADDWFPIEGEPEQQEATRTEQVKSRLKRVRPAPDAPPKPLGPEPEPVSDEAAVADITRQAEAVQTQDDLDFLLDFARSLSEVDYALVRGALEAARERIAEAK